MIVAYFTVNVYSGLCKTREIMLDYTSKNKIFIYESKPI